MADYRERLISLDEMALTHLHSVGIRDNCSVKVANYWIVVRDRRPFGYYLLYKHNSIIGTILTRIMWELNALAGIDETQAFADDVWTAAKHRILKTLLECNELDKRGANIAETEINTRIGEILANVHGV